MAEPVQAALATPGLVWILAAALVAGLVRGFSGFGTALVFVPVAALFVPPVWALTVLVAMDLVGPLPILPRALREADRADVARLVAGALVGLPIGVALLAWLPVTLFRWAVSLVALGLLALLISGWRYRGRIRRGLTLGTGALGGFLGGSTGLSGPPAILLYMASPLPAAAIRANLLLYLAGVDVLLIATFAATGRLAPEALVLALLAIPAYLVANIAGAAIFRPGNEAVYRGVAYAIIAASAITGLPIWR